VQDYNGMELKRYNPDSHVRGKPMEKHKIFFNSMELARCDVWRTLVSNEFL